MQKNWYRIDFLEGAKARSLCGSSELPPAEFVAQLASSPFVRLDDLIYRDSQNRFVSWSEWDPRLQPTAFINPASIVVVMPFVEDPRVGNRQNDDPP